MIQMATEIRRAVQTAVVVQPMVQPETAQAVMVRQAAQLAVGARQAAQLEAIKQGRKRRDYKERWNAYATFTEKLYIS